MERCLRLALWMFLSIGYLQAKPVTESQKTVPCFNMGDLGLNFLHEEVSCDSSENFTSPTNVQEHCYSAALQHFLNGLGQAGDKCKVKNERISDTVAALKQNNEIPKQPVNSTDCQWEKQPFTQFVKDIETFAEKVNSGKNC